MGAYRQRILELALRMLAPCGPVRTALDFGCGDGYFADQLRTRGAIAVPIGLEVQPRPGALIEAVVYDGGSIPFGDRSFDLVYAVDVLHHCADPLASLREMLRCADRLVLLKDHTATSAVGRVTLTLLDELGNRRFGVSSPGHYQHGWEWLQAFVEGGFVLEAMAHPASVHRGALGWLTNNLQFIGLWRRASDRASSS